LIDNYNTELEYIPLSLYNPSKNPSSTDFDLRKHTGGVPVDNLEVIKEEEIPSGCLINMGRKHQAKLLICITQYNEPLSQLVESLAGIYRSYYELCKSIPWNFVLITIHK
jgi:hypothetical protein